MAIFTPHFKGLMIRTASFSFILLLATLVVHAQAFTEKQFEFEKQLLSAHSTLNRPDSALLVLNALKPNSGVDSLDAEYYRMKASAFFYKGMIDSAIVSFSAAMAMIDSGACTGQYTKVANGLAVVLQTAGMRRNAIDYYSKALGCAEFRGGVGLKLKIFSNLSILNNELKDYNSSQFYINKALELTDDSDSKSLCALYNTKAQNFIAQDQLDSAIHFSELSLSFRSEDDLKGRALNLNNLGYIYGLKGENSRARPYFEQSAKIREEIGDLFGIASIFINMADLAIGEGDLDEANRLLQNVEILKDKINSKQIDLRMYASRSRLEEARGNTGEALEFLKRYQVIYDSLILEDQTKNMQYAQYGVALSEAQNKVKRIQKEEELRNETIVRQRIINLLLGVGIAIVIGLLSLLIYQLKILTDLRKELTAERDEAKRNAEFRRETLNSVVHELRTPMSAIVSLADLINAETDFEEIKKLTHLLSKSSYRLLNTTNNILTYSRIEQGSVDIVLHPVDIAELIREICAMLEIKAKSKSLELTFDLPQKLVARVDRSILEIILMNLIGNAIKFTTVGGVDVSLKEDKDYIQLSVSDTGPGISEEDIVKLFEPFFQGGADTISSNEGTGLGLSIWKHYADLMSAKIRVHSTLGEGSVFTLFIRKEH